MAMVSCSREASLQALERSVHPEFRGAAERQPVLDGMRGAGGLAAGLVARAIAGQPGGICCTPVTVDLGQRGPGPDVLDILLTVALGDVTQGCCDPPAGLFSEPRDKVIVDVEDCCPAVDRHVGRPIVSGHPGIKDLFCADHFAGVDQGYRPHVDEKRDSLLIASLGEKTSGLGKDPVILGAPVARPFVIRHDSYLAAPLGRPS